MLQHQRLKAMVARLTTCWRQRLVIELPPFNLGDGQWKSRNLYRYCDTINAKRATAPN
jgi:hypothetical protein